VNHSLKTSFGTDAEFRTVGIHTTPNHFASHRYR